MMKKVYDFPAEVKERYNITYDHEINEYDISSDNILINIPSNIEIAEDKTVITVILEKSVITIWKKVKHMIITNLPNNLW